MLSVVCIALAWNPTSRSGLDNKKRTEVSSPELLTIIGEREEIFSKQRRSLCSPSGHQSPPLVLLNVLLENVTRLWSDHQTNTLIDRDLDSAVRNGVREEVD